MKVAFLGTSGAFPTAERNASAHIVWVQGETVLLDCGEGTQRQVHRSGHRFNLDRIFLTHMHGDHVLGVPGYLWTLGLLRRTNPLHIYLPVGTAGYIASLIGPPENLGFKLTIEELEHGSVVQAEGYKVTAVAVDHVPGSLGFRIDEHTRPGKVDVEAARKQGLEPGPELGRLVAGESVRVGDRLVRPEDVLGPPRAGRSLVYSGDTRPCKNMVALAKDADLLIHEAMFTRAMAQEARTRGHSSSVGAAKVALEAGVRRLALTHISHRHQTSAGIREITAEARAIFSNAFLPDDLDELEIPLRD